MLGQLSQYPPSVVKQILAVIQNKVMSLGESVPGSLQAEPFADSALSQVDSSFCMHAIRWLSASTNCQVVESPEVSCMDCAGCSCCGLGGR